MRVLSERHEVHLFALSDKPVESDTLSGLEMICASVTIARITRWDILKGLVWAFLHKQPFQIGYFRKPKARQSLKNCISAVKPDVIFGQLIRVAGYLRETPGIRVLDYQDALSLNMQRRAQATPFPARLIFRREARLLKKAEKEFFSDYDLRLIISEPDRDAICHPENSRIRVVPNGVDFGFFHPELNTAKDFDIVFTGNMAYQPNIEGAVWLAGTILPLIRKSLPQTTLLIAGASPVGTVRRLAGNGVTVSGWMPDIRDAYNRSKLFIAPMKSGSGLQNKLLEAMSMRLPCITTPLANNALHAIPGKHLLLGESGEELAGAAVRLLKDFQFAENMADNGQNWVRKQFRWNETIGNFETELQRIVSK